MNRLYRLVHSCIYLLIFICSLGHLSAQYLELGPVTGAVTHKSAKVYAKAKSPGVILFQLMDSSAQLVSTIELQTRALDHSAIAEFGELEPYHRYSVNLFFNNKPDSLKGSFKTFPMPGQVGSYTFVTGSCQETDNMKVFDQMASLEPLLLIHTGDYTYPDYQIGPDYSKDKSLVAYSYHKRYREKRMQEMLQHVPIDYVYDDNDYVGGNGTRYHKNTFKSLAKNKSKKGIRIKENRFIDQDFPAIWRRNVIEGYAENFPTYPLPDTSTGIYHSFVLGNAEFFFLDRCSAREKPVSYAFRQKGKRYIFDPPADNCLFCGKQMAWLKAGLKNSTADWKFIVSGVPLNRSMLKLIKAGQAFQRYQMKGFSGFHLMQAIASYWVSAPVEMEDFYQFIERENIKNLIVISGDTHHNVMDDGKNAGLPELNASGLSVTGTNLGYYLKLLGNITMRFNYKKGVWNQGGNGLGNKNFKNAFGRIRIEGKSYVELSIVDEDGAVISSMKVPYE